MSKFCKYCGSPLVENAKFCIKCGKSVGNIQKTADTGASGKIMGSPSSGSFYLIDFFRNAARKSNIPIFVYLVLNVIIISFIVIGCFQLPIWLGTLAGIVLYLISLTIALSPIGEWMLRKQTKCREITDAAEKRRLEPLFQEVYQNARRKDPSIPGDIKLYVSDEKSPNAFATGRKTVCVTRGLLMLPDNEIKATLGHEFGHLSHHDTDMILVVSVGNMIISALVFMIRIMVYISEIIAHIVCAFTGGEGGFLGSLMISLSRILFDVMVMGAMWIWTKLGVLLVMKSSRDNEFEADRFSAELGYGAYLCSMLDIICGNQGHMKGLFANLASSHPDKASRIAKLRSIGVKY
ncbi:MAG: M48 family metalloprotease [Eubacteriales bacterium]|nr:M48 family metalloprotease [Eubacteriales bacterium]